MESDTVKNKATQTCTQCVWRVKNGDESLATVHNRNDISSQKINQELKEAVKVVCEDEKGYNDFSDDNTILRFKKLTANAATPIRGSRHAAGFDLFSAETKEVVAHGHSIVNTDITVMLPQGTYGRVAPRSGLAAKYFIDIGAGVIDADYRGNVGVVIFNHLNKPFLVNKGDRIAQLIIEKISTPKLVEVEQLEKTERGTNGYGSTGQ